MAVFRGRIGAQAASSSGQAPSAARSRFAGKLAATEQLLRSELRHDLSHLVNSIALESTVDLDAHRHVRDSILNYGVPDIVWRTIDEDDIDSIREELRVALQRFEPRIVPQSIVVERDVNAQNDRALRFSVRGDMICDPVQVPIEFLADIEPESRKITIQRL